MGGKIYTSTQKLPAVVGPTLPGGTPWVNPEVARLAENAATAGKMTHVALEKSRGSMGLGSKI